MPFLLLLLPMLAKLPGLFGDFFAQKNAIEQAKVQTELAVEQAKLALAGQMAQDEMELSKTVLGSTSPHFKYFTFFMWFGPFMLGCFWPAKAHDIFTNLALMPEWYVQSCMMIMFTVWGISVASPVIGNIFSGLGDFFAAKRADGIEAKRVDKQAIFDAIRHIKGTVSPADVKLWNPVIDEVNKES